MPGAEAAVRISGLELGGLLGSLSAGAISDRLIKSNTDPDVGNVGLRVKAGGLDWSDPAAQTVTLPTCNLCAVSDASVHDAGLVLHPD